MNRISKLKKKSQLKSKKPQKGRKSVAARKSRSVSNAKSTEAQQYIFTPNSNDYLAAFDSSGGAIEIVLSGFVDYFNETTPGNWENIVFELLIGVLIHEDIHVAISNSGENWSLEAEHELMNSLFNPVKKVTYS